MGYIHKFIENSLRSVKIFKNNRYAYILRIKFRDRRAKSLNIQSSINTTTKHICINLTTSQH